MSDMLFSPRCLAVVIGTWAEFWSPMGDRNVIKRHTAFGKFLPCRPSFQTAICDTNFQIYQAPFPIGRSFTPATQNACSQIFYGTNHKYDQTCGLHSAKASGDGIGCGAQCMHTSR